MSFLRLQTPKILEARRKAYELDLFWPPTFPHADFAQHILSSKFNEQYEPSLGRVTRPGTGRGKIEGTLENALGLNRAARPGIEGEVFPRIREFAKAEPVIQRLIDPTYAAADKL